MKNILLSECPERKSTVGKAVASSPAGILDTTTSYLKDRREIPAIFAADGEGTFRELETDALSEASKLSGKVIATGGGAVLTEENRRLMRQNSNVIWLDRPIETLPTDGRPLSSDLSGLRGMFEKRSPLYKLVSDLTVKTGGPERIEEAAREIITALFEVKK